VDDFSAAYMDVFTAVRKTDSDGSRAATPIRNHAGVSLVFQLVLELLFPTTVSIGRSRKP
jgi:hypothetical protein